MKIIAIEEHFVMPQYRRNYNEYLTFFYKALSNQVGHDIPAQLLDLGEDRLRYMDAAGVDVQVLSIGYYNTDRPHSAFGGRTPDEVYATQASEEKLAA